MTSVGTVISYPIPPYQNLPIKATYYKPSQYFIEDVTLGVTTIVTTTEDVNYVVGQLVRLIIPPQFGCRQLNESQGYVLSLPALNEVEISIDSSRNVDNFVSSNAATQPQILAIGDIANGQINSSGSVRQTTYIPGSFINISPL